MQAITHFVVGALLQKFLLGTCSYPWNVIVIFFLAVLSHVPVDLFAFLTFHTPDPHPKWPFWLVTNVIFGIVGLLGAILLWNPYWWSMLASTLIDIYDWGFLRSVQAIKRHKKPGYTLERYFIHTYLDKFRDAHMSWLPNWTHKRRGVVPEICIILVCVLFMWY